MIISFVSTTYYIGCEYYFLTKDNISPPIIARFLVIAPWLKKANTFIVNVVGIKKINNRIAPKLLSFRKINKNVPTIMHVIAQTRRNGDMNFGTPAEFI